jgi:heptosyltransferase-3
MNASAPRSEGRILVIVLRRLGDVLLTTPLIRSLKQAYPQVELDALVFAGTEGILAGNPDLAEVIILPVRPSAADSMAIVSRLWRRYRIAVSTQTGDRPTWFAVAAGRYSAGPVAPSGAAAALKRLLLGRAVSIPSGQHRIEDVLCLAAALGIPPVAEVVCPSGPVRAGLLPDGDYAVIHAAPMFRYKRWTEAGWRALADRLAGRGLAVVATGGPAVEDRRHLDAVWREATAVRRLDGVLTWPELAHLIRRARLYVGPDTSVTHLAAATGTPTVALFGPTDPRRWGPWPAAGLSQPFAAAGTLQQRGNVWLVQNPLPCLPCGFEGCERRLDSRSRCLDELSIDVVATAADQALAQWRSGGKLAMEGS